MATPDPGLPRNIGAPATRALTAAGYTELGQLVQGRPGCGERHPHRERGHAPVAGDG